jgi:AcrR family transcriptional regulator
LGRQARLTASGSTPVLTAEIRNTATSTFHCRRSRPASGAVHDVVLSSNRPIYQGETIDLTRCGADEERAMPARRRKSNDDSATRTALLDAAEALMIEEGYAAVSSRRIAAKAGLPNAIHYYFETMDDLFIELFRRRAARSLARQQEALASPQPLWAFWDLLLDRSNGNLNMEFIALANHRKAIRSEIAESSRAFRRGQLVALADVIETSKSTTPFASPEAIILLLSSVSRFLTTENAFDLDLGHAEVIGFVEQCIQEIEGDRLSAAKP